MENNIDLIETFKASKGQKKIKLDNVFKQKSVIDLLDKKYEDEKEKAKKIFGI
ncbi:hypothetical protein [Mammaliicoccus vitulinus]|uniref:hypothetical protein n=1 Tax=Mammaliicoccus vitulinus TaxID=71237 RepID=UPI00248B0FB3|nr:hypothetical protein [Mammaliicoccus vitulinus]